MHRRTPRLAPGDLAGAFDNLRVRMVKEMRGQDGRDPTSALHTSTTVKAAGIIIQLQISIYHGRPPDSGCGSTYILIIDSATRLRREQIHPRGAKPYSTKLDCTMHATAEAPSIRLE